VGNGTFDYNAILQTADGAMTFGPQVMLDFDGDGPAGLCRVPGLPNVPLALFRHRGNPAKILTVVTDGLGRPTLPGPEPYSFVRNNPFKYRDPSGFMGESVPQAVDPEKS
jgi:hypothetical protein